MVERVSEQTLQVFADLVELLENCQRLVGFSVDQRVGQCGHLLVRHQAKHRQHILLGDLVPAERDQLIERTLGVAQSAFGTTRNRGQRLVVNRDLLLLCNLLEMLDDEVRRDAAQIKSLAARQDGRQHFLWLGRREEKLYVRRRLFERFQQRVEGFLREHMHFVDDVDLELAARRSVPDRVPKFAHFVDAAVAGAVDFQYVERTALGDLLTVVALVARFGRRTFHTVQCLGEDARGGSLADAARADEEVGVGQPVLFDGVLQRGGDMLLSNHVVELLWPPFAGQHLVLLWHSLLARKRDGRAPRFDKRRRFACCG